MIFRFSRDLSLQRIFANGTELASVMGLDRDRKGQRIADYPKEHEVFVTAIQRPVLVTDVYRIAKLPPSVRDTVFKLYESPVRRTEYNGVTLDFEQGKYTGAWGPSIDTLLFCRALNDVPREYFRGKSIIEIGAGSGFISKYILEKFSGVTSITLVDLNPRAIRCCKDNIQDRRATFVCGDAVRYMGKRQYDIIICNPPYIPRERDIGDNAYEGTMLTTHILSMLPTALFRGGSFFTNISSLSADEVYSAAKMAGATITVLDRMVVPLKVMNVLNNATWMRYLKKGGLRKTSRKGYDYYQSLEIVRITLPYRGKKKGA